MPSTNYIVLVDGSRSMERFDARDANNYCCSRIQAAWEEIAVGLQRFDFYGALWSLAVFTSSVTILVTHVDFFKLAEIIKQPPPVPRGPTHFSQALVAAESLCRGDENDVILISDGRPGDWNENTFKHFKKLLSRGVAFHTVSLGETSNIVLRQIAALSNGEFRYADTSAESIRLALDSMGVSVSSCWWKPVAYGNFEPPYFEHCRAHWRMFAPNARGVLELRAQILSLHEPDFLEVEVVIRRKPFLQGQFSYCYGGVINVIDKSKAGACGDICGGGTLVVFKMPRDKHHQSNSRRRQEWQQSLQMRLEAARYGEDFSRRVGIANCIVINRSYGVKLDGKLFDEYTEAEKYLSGPYRKWIRNDGIVIIHDSLLPLLEAFVHFSFHESGHRLAILDVQGVPIRAERRIVLTDLQLTSNVVEGAYGARDLGPAAIRRYMKHHQCNDFCRSAGLPETSSQRDFVQVSPPPPRIVSSYRRQSTFYEPLGSTPEVPAVYGCGDDDSSSFPV